MPRIVSLFLVLTVALNLQGQVSSLFQLRYAAQQKKAAPEKITSTQKKGPGNFLLTIYQQGVSPVIAADCLYSPSCSRFSRQAINKYGLVKGVLITADRLTRCSAFCGKDIPLRNFDEDGLAKDNP
jgi:putative membrane protein insertion efficiency factor